MYGNNGVLVLYAADWSSGGTIGLVFRSGYDVPYGNNYNYSILTYDHDG
jgi:hypothetical protein